MINGEVRPPATYLRAEEILRRQYIAHLVDEFARDPHAPPPAAAPRGAIGSSEPGTFLGDLIAHAETRRRRPRRPVPRDVRRPARRRSSTSLRDWLRPRSGPRHQRASPRTCTRRARRWQRTVETLKHRVDGDRRRCCPSWSAKAESPAATDDDQRALRSAQTALQAHPRPARAPARRVLDRRARGARPAAQLHPARRQRHPRRRAELDRPRHQRRSRPSTPSSSAARRRRSASSRPAPRFYARGWEIAIDAVDLGVDGVAIRPWVFCPACGFAADIAADGRRAASASCPRCGSTGIADTGQRLDVVELTHVTAEIRRDEASISDRRDQRDNRDVPASSPPPTSTRRRSGAAGSSTDIGFGCTLPPRDGPAVAQPRRRPGTAPTGMIAGERALRRAVPGVLAAAASSTPTPGATAPHEHRPWCRYRTATDENTATVALSRTLRTQGLLLRLPNSVTDRRRLRRAQPGRGRAAGAARAARRAPRPHPRRAGRRPDARPTAPTTTTRSCCTTSCPAAPATSPSWPTPNGCASCWSRRGSGSATASAATRHGWPATAACCRSSRPAQVPRVSRASAERHLRTLLGVDRRRRSRGAVDDHRAAAGGRPRVPPRAAVPQGARRAAADARRHRHRGSRGAGQRRARSPCPGSTGTGR